MARPYSSGVQYFSLDVGYENDPKIRLVRAEFGWKGELAYIRLLSVIYKQGYYIVWDDDAQLLFAESFFGVSVKVIEELTKGFIRRGLFDKRVFDESRVLTSRGIQRRYMLMKEGSARIYMHKDLLLVDLDDTEYVPAGVRGKVCLKTSFREENPRFKEENPGFKEDNYIKEKKSKVNIPSCEGIDAGKPAQTPAPKRNGTASRFRAPTLKEVRAYCEERQNGIDAQHFIDYYESNGWKVGKNRMKDWKAAVRSWEHNGVSGAKKTDTPPPSYDLDAIMRSAVDFDPTKTRRGEV